MGTNIKKSLFDDHHRYTEEAAEIESEIVGKIGNVFDRWVYKGYNPREIYAIISGAVFDAMCDAVINFDPSLVNDADKIIKDDLDVCVLFAEEEQK